MTDRPPISEALYVWWLDEADMKVLFGKNERILPGLKGRLPLYLVSELRSRYGRAGRRRLWVSRHLPSGVIAAPWGNPDGEWPFWISDDCGGIVFEASELSIVRQLPGIITDLWLRPVSDVPMVS